MDESDVDEANDDTNEIPKSDDEEAYLSLDRPVQQRNGAYQDEDDPTLLESGYLITRNDPERLSSRGAVNYDELPTESITLDSPDAQLEGLPLLPAHKSFENQNSGTSSCEERLPSYAPLEMTSACTNFMISEIVGDGEEKPSEEFKQLRPEIVDSMESRADGILKPWVSDYENKNIEISFDAELDFLSCFSFPSAPQNLPETDGPKLAAENPMASSSSYHSVRSSLSSSSFNMSYIASLASMEQKIPDRLDERNDRQLLIPEFKRDTRQYCWPVDTLPLDGEGRFDEGVKWCTVGKAIGGGASGECYLANIIPAAREPFICVKKLKGRYNKTEIDSLYLSGKSCFIKEDKGSNNIVHFFGATICKRDVNIFMELMQGDTVDDWIKEGREISKANYLEYLTDVVSALEFLHGKGIVHNDVKASNVLLDPFGLKAKLADFGNATPRMKNNNHTSNDIWGACCFLLEMLGNWCKSDILKHPLLVQPNRLKALLDLQPHPDGAPTTDLLKLFVTKMNDHNIYSKIKRLVKLEKPLETTIENLEKLIENVPPFPQIS